MTPRTISYAAACLAAAATLSAAFDGSVAALYVAGPLLGCSFLGAAVFAALHWRRGRQASAALKRTLHDAVTNMAIPEPDWAFLSLCVWCADTSKRALPGECQCKTPCEGISWCGARPRAADLEATR